VTTEREAFGSGLKLSGSDWDFNLSNTGSMDTVEGLQQLEKKLAYATTKTILPEIGRPRTDEALEDIGISVGRIARQDPRIDSVENVEATRSDTDHNRVDVTLQVVGDDGEEHRLSYGATATA
jgi:hypothetical protein